MDAVIDFTSGPLFRLTFAICVFGVVRLLFLSISDMWMMVLRAGEKNMPWGDLIRTTATWVVPVTTAPRQRPLYSLASILFHIGLILVPVFYSAHVLLWDSATGLSWGFWLPQMVSHVLTITCIVSGVFLLFTRFKNHGSRRISKGADYFYVSLLLVPFITGITMTNGALAPKLYQWMMLLHLLSANLILVLIPFTKVAHVVLFPLGRFIGAAAWKFPKGAGDRVMTTLGKEKMREEMPV